MMTAGAPILAARITPSALVSCAVGLARCGASSVSRIRTLFVGDVAAHKYCLPAQNPAKHLARFRFLVELLPNPFGYVDSVKQDRNFREKPHMLKSAQATRIDGCELPHMLKSAQATRIDGCEPFSIFWQAPAILQGRVSIRPHRAWQTGRTILWMQVERRPVGPVW